MLNSERDYDTKTGKKSAEILKSERNTENAAPKKVKSEKIAEFQRFLKFLAFSLSAGAIQIISFEILLYFTDKYWYSYLPALILSVLWNFTLNRKFTFKSANNVPVAMLLVAGYYGVFTPLSTWAGDALVDTYGWNEQLVLIITMITNFVTEFLFDRFVVFRNSINTNVKDGNAPEIKVDQPVFIVTDKNEDAPADKE